ncbi:MAG TPA: glycoside hydrolase family 88 protein [Chitinophagaceae bacterium]|nr:glycoside hydrolase family 88 protein [Chitinophagaceae bacterium]
MKKIFTIYFYKALFKFEIKMIKMKFSHANCLIILFACIIISGCGASKKATTGFSDFPAGTSPQEIGKIVVNRYLELPYQNFNRPAPPRYITYPETCTCYGALTFAKATDDKSLVSKLAERFDPLFGSRDSLIPPANHVDYSVFGAVPFELYIQTKDQKYLDLGKKIADAQWTLPKNPKPEEAYYNNKGMTWQTRMWIDDMFMITAVQAQAYRATGNEQYINRAAKEMVLYLDTLQKPNGLFYHAPDVPFFWGRGNGWMAAGMTELLRSLPKNNPDRSRIMQGYKTMMASLLKYQSADGMWRQLIDDPSSWPETSSTGMFTFAFITGVKEGWLDAKSYGPAAHKAWLSLIKYINDKGDISEVCEGTNKKNDRQYYLDRKRNIGDLHGQAPILWCATALLR